MEHILSLMAHGTVDALMLVVGLWAVAMPIITLHEMGHFLVGYWLGARPSDFSIGLGPSLFTFKWLGTDIKFCPLPLGGYIRFKSKRLDFEPDEEGEVPIEKIAPMKWFYISLAGPLSNFLLSGLILVGVIFQQAGYIEKSTILASRDVESEQYLKAGEEVLFLNEMSLLKTYLGERVNHLGAIKITGFSLKVIPVNNPKLINSFVYSEHHKINLLKRIGVTVLLTTEISKGVVEAVKGNLKELFSSPKGTSQLTGIIGIANESKHAISNGIFDYLFLVFGLSLSVGFFNLLPLAFLDGGVALMSLVEVISKKPIAKKYYDPYAYISFGLLLCLLSLGLYNDVKNSVIGFFHAGK